MDCLKIEKIKDYLLTAALFILPLQTRYFLKSVFLNGIFWEYGSLYLYATEILIALILILQIYLFFKDKIFLNNIKNSRHSASLIVFVALFLTYLFLSKDFWLTWQYFEYFFYAFGLMSVLILSRLHIKYIILSFWSGAVVSSILAIWQFFSQNIVANKWLGIAAHDPGMLGTAVVEFQDERWLRAYGFFGWPTSLAIYLVVAFLLGILLSDFFLRQRLLVLVGQIFILSAIFFTFARGAWLALLFSLVIVIYKNFRKLFFWQQLSVFVVFFLVLLVIFKPLVFNRFNLNNRLERRSVNERVEQWSDFKKIFKNNELLGVGPGLYTKALYENGLKKDYDLEPVHNIFLLFLGEWGVLGVVIFYFIFLYNKQIMNWSFAPIWALAIFGLFDHWLLSMFTGMIFLAVVAGFGNRLSTIDTLPLK